MVSVNLYSKTTGNFKNKIVLKNQDTGGKIENGNGECAKETTTRTLKKTTAEGHQQVFNVTLKTHY